MKQPIAIAFCCSALLSCGEQEESGSAEDDPSEQAAVESFGEHDGREAKLYTLTNANGMVAKVTDFGATLVSLHAPDKNGEIADVTHGFDSVAGYASDANPYFGATVGRFGNRIADGTFTLEGEEYQLATNNEPGGIPCHLHGGDVGFNKRFWEVESADEDSVRFKYVSEDGEEGYPGTLTAIVTYTLNDDNELIWEAEATTDAPTIVNLVHHSYWNLSGDPTSTINDHVLTLKADRYLPTNAGLIPTGELAPVEGTPMDFTEPTPIGERVNADFEALELGGGYDHAWVLSDPDPDGLALAARLRDPESGRTLEVHSNQPAVQFYGGNFLDEEAFQGDGPSGKDGVAYPFRSACCLETENFPDAPNQEDFPSAVLRPGETYQHKMVHRFSAE